MSSAPFFAAEWPRRGRNFELRSQRDRRKMFWGCRCGRRARIWPASEARARHCRETDCGIVDGAAMRANVIERESQRTYAFSADLVIRRFESHYAAHGRGNSDGAAGVGARSHEDRPGRYRCRGSAAGAAGNAVCVPRVADGAIVRIGGRDAVAKLVQIGFADHHTACLRQASDDFRVFVGHAIGEDFRACRGADALGVDDVLVCDRDAMEGSAIDAARQFFIE